MLVTARRTTEVETESWATINLDWDGVVGGAYNGRTRVSDSRVLQQHRPDTQISNVRQLSILSREDIDHIAHAMGISQFNPEWLGANLVVSGCLDFSCIPSSSRLQANNVTTVIVDMQNYPYHQIGITIERDLPGYGKSFKQHAKGRRGVTAWAERPEQLALGDKMRLHRPEQWAWRPDGQALLLLRSAF